MLVHICCSVDSHYFLQRLRAQKDEAVSHDNVFSSLLGFFGVETKEYDKKLDIFK